MSKEKVNILLVDDQPSKLLSYEAILQELDENLIQATSARHALELLLKSDVAIVLLDVCMPELDGFDLAAMIREHPRFQHIAIIFVSAIHLADIDHLRGYEMGAVDYVPVPVVPEVLRAKVRVFADLYRKTRELQVLNQELERRVAERTADLEKAAVQLTESERRRTLALSAGQMGSWDWDRDNGDCYWDAGQREIFGVGPEFAPRIENIRALIHADDWLALERALPRSSGSDNGFQTELRIIRPDGATRWCLISAAATFDADGRMIRLSGVTIDITDRKQAEERQGLLAREVDHRARNTLAIVQAIVRLTQAKSTDAFVNAVEGRIQALAQTHKLLAQSSWQGANVGQLADNELAPYRVKGSKRISAEGPLVFVPPDAAQTIAMALHELSTNAAKYGALSSNAGRLSVTWHLEPHRLVLHWTEIGGPAVKPPQSHGFGTKIINASIKAQMGGHVHFEWRLEGVRCAISLPYQEGHRGEDEPGSDNLIALRPSSEKRLLLVEDEAVVGMMMREILTELGFFVIGPVCTVGEALAAAHGQVFDGAVLDVNLGGEMIYPVAEKLEADSVPFVFVTGYDELSLNGRFAGVPIVQKPVARETLEAALASAVGVPAKLPVDMRAAVAS